MSSARVHPLVRSVSSETEGEESRKLVISARRQGVGVDVGVGAGGLVVGVDEIVGLGVALGVWVSVGVGVGVGVDVGVGIDVALDNPGWESSIPESVTGSGIPWLAMSWMC